MRVTTSVITVAFGSEYIAQLMLNNNQLYKKRPNISQVLITLFI
jgi:hypothetical protein